MRSVAHEVSLAEAGFQSGRGMEGDADMVLEQRRIYEWLIEPIWSFRKLCD